MKISFNLLETPEGGAGGGFSFRDSLSLHLNRAGHEVTNNLEDKDIDIIFLISPLPSQSSNSYDFWGAIKYKYLRNPRVKIIHRVNYTGLTRNPPNRKLDKQLAYVNNFADFTTFISEWIKRIQQDNGIGLINYKVILNGADSEIFYKKKEYRNPKDQLSIVTHHWSDNKNKGYEIYKYLDTLMGQENIKSDFSFSYIGNLDPVDFPNTHYLGPMNRKELAKALRQYDIYITAADLEAAGMHHIEAGCSGLPILFLENSSIKEYVEDFGESYTLENLLDKLYLMKENYYSYVEKMQNYSNYEELSFSKYEAIINELNLNKKNIKITLSNKIFIIFLPLIKVFHPLFFTNNFLLYFSGLKMLFLKITRLVDRRSNGER